MSDALFGMRNLGARGERIHLRNGPSKEVFLGARCCLRGGRSGADGSDGILERCDQRGDLCGSVRIETKIACVRYGTFTALSSDADVADAVTSKSPSAGASTSPREARAKAASCSCRTMAWMWGRASTAEANLIIPLQMPEINHRGSHVIRNT